MYRDPLRGCLDLLVNPAEIFQGTVLIAAPHMDDEVLACGGTVSKLPNKDTIHIVYVTDGMKSPSPIVPWRDSITMDLGEVRMRESKSAMRFLGVPEKNTHFLALPEAKLTKYRSELREMLLRLIREIRPDHIFMPFRYDRHPDHLAVNQVITAEHRQGACRYSSLYEYFIYYRWRLLPARDVRRYVRPEYLLEVNTEDVAGKKRIALDCFKSQTTKYYPWQTRPILMPNLLDERAQNPEVFLRYDPAVAGNAVFSRATFWIQIVHGLEPFLQKWKYRVGALLYRAVGINGSCSS